MNRSVPHSNRAPHVLLALLAGVACAFSPITRADASRAAASAADSTASAAAARPETTLRWKLRNTRMLLPTANLERAGDPLPLPAGKPLDPDRIAFTVNGTTLTLGDYLRRTQTDGFIVIRDGRVVLERYFDGFGPHQTHMWASMTKSVTGLLAAQLIVSGKLAPQAPLSTYVPELAGTPFGNASLQRNLDMEVPVRYPAALPPDLGLFAAVGFVPRASGAPDSIHRFLTVALPVPDAQPNGFWYYQNGSPEAVAWAIRRVTGESWHALASREIWRKLADDGADIVVDHTGTEMASGGLNTTLRDAARFGELVRTSAAGDDTRFPSAATRLALQPASNVAAFARGNLAPGRPGYGYHDYWYQMNDGHGTFAASGRFGQAIVVDPRERLTVVKFSSSPDTAARPTSAAGGAIEHASLDTADTLHRAVMAIAKAAVDHDGR
ncbi:beta-lactamase family protein [Burkholderia multivorans]|uniref:6-aminohexanoate hydrolase n=1 Tax=Burkholderia multivorans TaxID=87883 RepID=A0AB37ALW3_9BURK|nr:serine hydrolase [Burkholderia multivorans]KVT37204.1 6-aminohexanoate hydrolase [Burkholderia multivorans]MBU9398663.1 beta-lactamase family protein [Burkholderia multivorans]MBU9589629.1 beta-lactamase family protein [Burkholderia multivorans]PRE39296.1 6-aminohexanoate hydrolase [Burkholderia multivorans]PRE42283.1 6-aminohexanoate hydrolase [Burkholderia multivorans]